MDLARTPAVPSESALPERLRDRQAAVRLLSADEACDPLFVKQWSSLALEAAEPNPFYEPWFVLPSLSNLGDQEDCFLLTSWAGERLTGLLPLIWPRRYYGYRVPHVAAWLHDNAFCAVPLVARGSEARFWRDLLAFLDHDPRRAVFLHCPELPAGGPLNAALDAVLEVDGRHSAIIDKAERAMLSSNLSPDAYLAEAMSAKKRKELRRQHKRLAEEGELSFERHDDSERIGHWISDFLKLEAAGWKGDAGSALSCEAQTRGFFTEALTGAADAGKLERLALRLNGKPIAMLANFVTSPGVFSFKTAFDETYARFSPGLLLQIENLDLLARQDVDWADSCAVPGHSMIERIWREKRTIIARNIAIGGPLRRATFRVLAAYETRGSKGS